MKNLLGSVGFAMLVLASSAYGQSNSLNCNGPQNQKEEIACTKIEIQILTERMTNVLKNLYDSTKGITRSTINSSQQAWKTYAHSQCSIIKTDVDASMEFSAVKEHCLKEKMSARLHELDTLFRDLVK